MRAWTGLIQTRGQRHQPVTRRATVGRLDADGAGHGCRLANRAAGVGTDRQRHLEGGQRGGRAAGTARNPVQGPRIVSGSVGRVLGGGPHGELVHVGLAQDHQIRVEQPLGHGRVVRRDPTRQDLAAGRRGTGIGQHILERERNTGERSDLLPVRDLGVDAHRGVHCPLTGSMCRKACTAGSTPSIRCRWARVTSTELSSRDLILAARSTAVARMIAFTPPPRGWRTRNRSSSLAGAPASTSSRGSDGRSTSSRNTFVSGRVCDVGSMSSAATSENPGDRIQDHLELRSQVLELIGGELDPGQLGQIGHIAGRQCHRSRLSCCL